MLLYSSLRLLPERPFPRGVKQLVVLLAEAGADVGEGASMRSGAGESCCEA